MSAVSQFDKTEHKRDEGLKVYYFEQNIPIPAYLIAFVTGKLESRDIGPRTKVYAEAATVDAAAYDFSQTEEFLKYAEEIMDQEYVWGRYDILCLPPSFPFGGMENPCLTFVTPTLLSGDKSLADVIAHEIAHSWTGNLVTNKGWESFWLNEGWTMWLQRKIMVKIHKDEKFFDFDAITGYNALRESVEAYGYDHPFTALVPNLDGRDPDDSFSSVPYEKGFDLLFYLTKVVGGHKNFEKFAKEYIQEYKYKTLNSQEFKEYFLGYFEPKAKTLGIDLSQIDWDTWYFKPGMPPVDLGFDQTLSKASIAVADKWLKNAGKDTTEAEVKGWSTTQWIVMLEHILNIFSDEGVKMSKETLHKMDKLYSFSKSKNSELRFRWYMINLRSGNTEVKDAVAAFLGEQGRMKFTRPLYRQMFAMPELYEFGKGVFAQKKSFYHPICAKMVEADLNKASGSGKCPMRVVTDNLPMIGAAAAAVVAVFAIKKLMK